MQLTCYGTRIARISPLTPCDVAATFWVDLFILTGTAGSLSYWFVLFSRLPTWFIYPTFFLFFFTATAWWRAKKKKNIRVFQPDSFLIILFLLALACACIGIFTMRPDPDDLPHFHRALYAANHLRESIPLTTTYYDLRDLPELSAPHTLTAYETIMSLVARALHVRGISFIHNFGGTFPLFLAPIFYFFLFRTLELPEKQSLAAAFAAIVYILLSSATGADWANFTVFRVWVGKCIYVLLLLPLLWAVAMRYAIHGKKDDLLRLHCLTLMGIGLTSSSFFLTPYAVGLTCLTAYCLFHFQKAHGIHLLKAATILLPLAAFSLLSFSSFFPVVSDITVWTMPNAEYPPLKLIRIVIPSISLLILYLCMAIILLYKTHATPVMHIFLIYSLAAGVVCFLPGVHQILLKFIVKGAFWRLVFTCPLPAIFGLFVLSLGELLLERRLVFGALTTLCMLGVIGLKISSFSPQFFFTSPHSMKWDPMTRDLVRYAETRVPKASVGAAPYYPVVAALGTAYPDLQFITSLHLTDTHLLTNSPHASKLEARTSLNAYLNQPCDGDLSAEPLGLFLNQLDFIIVRKCFEKRTEDFLNGTPEVSWTHKNMGDYSLWFRKK